MSRPSRDSMESKSFMDALGSLFRLDCVRINRILETVEYAAIYSFISLFVGSYIDHFFDKLYPVKDEIETRRQMWITIGFVCLQVIISAVAVLYIRKMGDLFPFLFNVCPSIYVEHYNVKEIEGEIAIALVYVGCQVNLMRQLEKLKAYLYPKSQ